MRAGTEVTDWLHLFVEGEQADGEINLQAKENLPEGIGG